MRSEDEISGRNQGMRLRTRLGDEIQGTWSRDKIEDEVRGDKGTGRGKGICSGDEMREHSQAKCQIKRCGQGQDQGARSGDDVRERGQGTRSGD